MYGVEQKDYMAETHSVLLVLHSKPRHVRWKGIVSIMKMRMGKSLKLKIIQTEVTV